MNTRYLRFVTAFIAILVGSLILFKSVYAEVTVNSHPNQNTSALLASIPKELKNLPYAIYPGSPEYNTARFSANKRIIAFPHAIFTPRTPKEASFVLNMLRKYHLNFSIRSGGHGYEGSSLSSGYVFDLRYFNAITPNVKNQTVKIGAGVRLGNVIKTLGKLDFAIPTGTCPDVGVAGLTLGGGIGMLSRTYGLTCDSVTSITFLTADGKVIEVNKNSYPDLFWALRGAGNGSYGIALEFTFKMYYIPKVTYYELTWNWDPQKVSQIIKAWQTWFPTLPSTITSQLRMRYSHGKAEIGIAGLKVGDGSFNEWEGTFKNLKPTVILSTGRYADTSKYWSEKSKYPFFKMKSNIILQPLSDNTIKKILNFYASLLNDKSDLYVLFDFDGMGGKIPDMNTAFYPRQALTWWYQGIYWSHKDQEAQALNRSRQFYAEILPEVSKYVYANTEDYDVGNNYLDAYYGDHVDRLIQIKKTYDPGNVFHGRQSIPVNR